MDDTNCSISSSEEYAPLCDLDTISCKKTVRCCRRRVFRWVLGVFVMNRLYSGIDCESLHFLTEQREKGNVIVLDPRANVQSCVFSPEEESRILSFFKLYSLCDHQTLFEKWLGLNSMDML